MPAFTKKYYDSTKSLQPSPLLFEALDALEIKGRSALDLGCGAGRDTKLLLEKGFTVTAVDAEPLAEEYIDELGELGELTFLCSTFEDLTFGQYDIINARYSLPFNPPASFSDVIDNVLHSISAGGVFVGQLFGVNDEWNTPETHMTFHTGKDARQLFASLEIIKFEEKDENGILADGSTKHWHVFNIIARKQQSS